MSVMKWTAAAAVGLMLGLPAGADAKDLKIASGAPPPHPGTSHLYNGLAEYLGEDPNKTFNVIQLGPEVVGLGAMKDGLQTGLVDMGNLLPLYFPAELPNFALAGELSAGTAHRA